MAARSSDSSEDEEDSAALERLREAAWDPSREIVTYLPEASAGGGVSQKRLLPSTEPSLRAKVNLHEQDGNELQTTAEFRAHVAKKLGAILDSSITTWEHPLIGPAQNNAEVSETEDDGFRLFSSSVPGDAGAPEPLPSARRRRRRRERSRSSSSSEADQEWRRCQEAAVTAADILKQSGLPGARQDPRRGDLCQTTELSKEKKKKEEKPAEESGVEQRTVQTARNNFSGACKGDENVITEDAVRKRKKKKKARQNGIRQGAAETAHSNFSRREENLITEDALPRKKKKKKRKKPEGRLE